MCNHGLIIKEKRSNKMRTLNELSTLAYVKTKSTMKSIATKTKELMTEEKGASDILALIIVVGIVMVIGFIFKDQITNLAKQLWNSIVKGDGMERENINNWN